MKKSFLIFILVTISFLLLGQEKKSDDFTVERVPPFNFVSQEFKGSVTQVDEFMKEFMKNFFDQQLIPNGQPMALFHNEPKNADDKDVRFEIGFPVGSKEDVKVKSPLKMRELKLPATMKHVHTGPYQELFGVYEKLKGRVNQEGNKLGKGFTIHKFLNNPEYVRPEEIKTEVAVPLEETPSLAVIKKPRVKTGESVNYTVMYKSYRGSVDQIADFVQDFLKVFFAQNRTPMGQPMIIFQNIPKSRNDKDLKMDIGFPMPEKDQGEIKSYRLGRDITPGGGGKEIQTPTRTAPTTVGRDIRPLKGKEDKDLKMRKVQMNDVAYLEHIGPYEKIFEDHQEMLLDLKRQNFQTSNTEAIVILLNNPTLVRPEEIKAKIILPAGK